MKNKINLIYIDDLETKEEEIAAQEKSPDF
jgi:hypothetical protein